MRREEEEEEIPSTLTQLQVSRASLYATIFDDDVINFKLQNLPLANLLCDLRPTAVLLGSLSTSIFLKKREIYVKKINKHFSTQEFYLRERWEDCNAFYPRTQPVYYKLVCI